MILTNPYDAYTEVAEIRLLHLREDIAEAAKDFYRPLTKAEIAEIATVLIKYFIRQADENGWHAVAENAWFTANDFIVLCATHSHD